MHLRLWPEGDGSTHPFPDCCLPLQSFIIYETKVSQNMKIMFHNIWNKCFIVMKMDETGSRCARI